jgi:hypothetical protein
MSGNSATTLPRSALEKRMNDDLTQQETQKAGHFEWF